MHRHLRTELTCSEIIAKCKLEIEQKRSSLRKLTFEELELVAIQIQTFQQIINEEITRWREKNNVYNACSPVCKRVLRSFRMLEKKIEKNMVGLCNRSGSERASVIYMRSSQVDNGIDDQTTRRPCTENAKKEDVPSPSTMESTKVSFEIYNRQNGSDESRLHRDGSIAMSGVQVPVTANENRPNCTENITEEDTRLWITDQSSLRLAQVHVTDMELEMLIRTNGKGEDTQLFTNSKYLCFFPIFQTVFKFVFVFK